jgi:hypothetical protein
MNNEFISVLARINALAWFFWVFLNVLGAMTDTRSAEYTYNLSYGIVGILNIIVIGGFIVYNMFEWFEKSRNYFWKKRGR